MAPKQTCIVVSFSLCFHPARQGTKSKVNEQSHDTHRRGKLAFPIAKRNTQTN